MLLMPLLAPAQSRPLRPWEKPVFCPHCQSDRVVYIIYGEPQLDDELKRALKSHKVELGGCLVTAASKRWECWHCGHTWGKVAGETGNFP